MLLNFGRHDVALISGVDRRSSLKILGILFDEKLSFDDHVKCITKRATANFHIVFRLRRFGFSIPELTLLYKALVLPTLTYCCSVWGGTSDEDVCSSLNMVVRPLIEFVTKRSLSFMFKLRRSIIETRKNFAMLLFSKNHRYKKSRKTDEK